MLPEKEMIDIIGTISDRWLDRSPLYINNLPVQDAELDSVLSSCCLNLKLKDPDSSSQSE